MRGRQLANDAHCVLLCVWKLECTIYVVVFIEIVTTHSIIRQEENDKAQESSL